MPRLSATIAKHGDGLVGAAMRALRERLLPSYRYEREEIELYAKGWANSDNAKLIDSIKQKSMLHQETLALLYFFAGRAKGAILEIGPYIGGSTIAMAKALQQSGSKARLISIEMGGSRPSHPHLPSIDIIGDLKRNLAEYGVFDRVTLIEGSSRAEQTKAAVERSLAGRKIDLLFVDADGHVASDFRLYGRFLSRRAVLAIDDYVDHCGLKDAAIRWYVDGMRDYGIAEDLGLYQWGTWFGQRTGRALS